MPSFKYRPNHPMSNKNGMVESIYLYGEYDKGTAPNVISDIMPETRHMANGRHYTSKAAFRQATKDAGCIEVGNETKTLLQPRRSAQLDPVKRREDIRRAVYDIRNNRRGDQNG